MSSPGFCPCGILFQGFPFHGNNFYCQHNLQINLPMSLSKMLEALYQWTPLCFHESGILCGLPGNRKWVMFSPNQSSLHSHLSGPSDLSHNTLPRPCDKVLNLITVSKGQGTIIGPITSSRCPWQCPEPQITIECSHVHTFSFTSFRCSPLPYHLDTTRCLFPQMLFSFPTMQINQDGQVFWCLFPYPVGIIFLYLSCAQTWPPFQPGGNVGRQEQIMSRAISSCRTSASEEVLGSLGKGVLLCSHKKSWGCFCQTEGLKKFGGSRFSLPKYPLVMAQDATQMPQLQISLSLILMHYRWMSSSDVIFT